MKKTLFAIVSVLTLSFTVFAQSTFPKREFRAVWIATVQNIDWPSSKLLSTTQQRNEFIAYLDYLKSCNFNAVIVQIRPSCDAFYANAREPWSEWLMGYQGIAPSPFYDPLKFMIDETKKRGMEFHAWFNPYRSQVSASSSIHSSHISVTQPSWNLRFNSPYKMLDPGLPQVREYVTSIIMDVVRRYDIDGVHFDDYFYPYEGITNQDSVSWNLYRGNFTDRGDWRRNNVNTLIRMVYDSIMAVKPWVKFGISPFGIWKNSAAGTSGFEAYYGIYCDAVAWLQERKVDYIMPQIYWAFARPQAPYGTLAQWWQTVLNGRHLYIGHGAYNMSKTDNFPIGSWPSSELCDQIRFNRLFSNIHGSSFFSAKHVRTNVKNFADSLRHNLYRYPALPPLMRWKDSIPPLPPVNLSANYNPVSVVLYWQKPEPAQDGELPKYYVIYKAIEPDTININDPKYILKVLPTDTTVYTDAFSLQLNKKYTYIVTSVDRLHNESPPLAKVEVMLTSVDLEGEIFTYNLSQNFPNPFNPSTKIEFTIAKTAYTELKVFDILGREVETLISKELSAGKHEVEFDGSNLPSGVYIYQLRSGEFIQTKKMILQK